MARQSPAAEAEAEGGGGAPVDQISHLMAGVDQITAAFKKLGIIQTILSTKLIVMTVFLVVK